LGPTSSQSYLYSCFHALVSLVYIAIMNAMPCSSYKRINHPRKKTSILAFLAGLSNNPVPLLKGLPPIPRGLPPTPDANFLPVNADELLGRGWIGEEYVPNDEAVDAPNCCGAGEGVPNETERGDSCLD
jgi:hypothetical protein